MHAATLLYPADWQAHHYRALALRNLDRLQQAWDELSISQKLHESEATVCNLIVVGLLMGRQADVSAYLGSKNLSEASRYYYTGLALVLSGDMDGAGTAFQNVFKRNDRLQGLAAGAYAASLAEMGRDAEAEAVLQRGIEAEKEAGNPGGRARKLLARAHLRLGFGDRPSARSLAVDAARLSDDTGLLQRAGSLLARAGFPADARLLRQRMSAPDQGRRIETAQAIVDGEIALAEGSNQRAAEYFRKADRLAPAIHPRDFLARAWQRLGRVEDALAAWRRIADWPALVWNLTPDAYDPGIWSESLLRVAELSLRSGRAAEGRTVLDRFLKMRPNADGSALESVLARQLLELTRH